MFPRRLRESGLGGDAILEDIFGQFPRTSIAPKKVVRLSWDSSINTGAPQSSDLSKDSVDESCCPRSLSLISDPVDSAIDDCMIWYAIKLQQLCGGDENGCADRRIETLRFTGTRSAMTVESEIQRRWIALSIALARAASRPSRPEISSWLSPMFGNRLNSEAIRFVTTSLGSAMDYELAAVQLHA
mgnify:CR=1 FL=1